MPVELEMTAQGLWSWLYTSDDPKRRRLLTREVRKAQKQAMREWATRGSPGKRSPDASLSVRFSPRAMSLLGLTRRSARYEQRVRKFYGGRYLPYTSPRKGATTSSPSGLHLRDLVTLPGGFGVSSKNNQSPVVETTIRIRAARVLNFHPEYRREFLGFGRGDRASPKWIADRSNGLATQALFKRFQRGRTRIIVKRERGR